MSNPEAPDGTFGQRHPVLTIVGIVFVAGFGFGALQGEAGFPFGALMGGIGGVFLFLLLSGILALIMTVVQGVSRAVRGRSLPTEPAGAHSIVRRFMRNLVRTTDFWIRGWH